jgi:protoporphyrinogen/coproporphyrinogen III oxidase
MAPHSGETDCIVIGAGPAGLAAAHRLHMRGMNVIVLESAEQVGGRTRSMRHEDSIINTGAAFFASFYTETLRLCRSLGVALIQPSIHPSRSHMRRHMVTPKGRIPFGPSDPLNFLRFPVVPLSQKLRLLRVLTYLRLATDIHVADISSLAAYDDEAESATTWARRKLGDQAYEYFVRPAIEPFFYAQASDVSAALAMALLRHALGWRLYTPRYGTDALCIALAAQIDVRTSTPALAIQRDSSRFIVDTPQGGIRAGTVILAGQTVDMCSLEAPLSPADAADLRAVDYEASIVLFLGYAYPLDLPVSSLTIGGPGPHALVGLTALADGGPPGLVAAGQEILAILTMGWRSRQLLDLDDEALIAAITAHAEALGITLPWPNWTMLFRRRHATIISRPGMLRRVEATAHRPRSGIHLAGDWLAGSSTVEGAVRSGHRAADAVWREFAE